MPRILDLIEMGFGEELDPHGWKMLHQMRRIYEPSALTRAVASAAFETAGFVWVEDGDVVGNLSIRHAYPSNRQGRLIGNVVVHPDYRNRGIGRALMERAIEAARDQRAEWAGLEVRADNEIACRLYEQLGFRAVGITEHLLRPEGSPWPLSKRPDRRWRHSKPQDRLQWRHLASLLHNYDQRLILELRTDRFRTKNIEGWIKRWLSRQFEETRVHEDDMGHLDLTLHVETDRGYRYHTWDVLLHPDTEEEGTRELMAQSMAMMRRLPTWPVVAIVANEPALLAMLTDLGFRKHRTLQQMILAL
jgi:ribosomal protein S18 acetylase RimI-like enzyme